MKVVAIIQARMGSTRLPGKVMMDLAGEPVLARVVNRVMRATKVDEVVVATTVKQTDNVILQLCEERSWRSYRGSEEDVLDRYYQAAKTFRADVIVRITSDCPLIDPELIDLVVERFLSQWPNVDYVSSGLHRTYPRGLDVSAMSFDALAKAWSEDVNPAWREHVTPFLYRHPERFRLFPIVNDQDYAHLRWTLDTDEDMALIRKIYQYFESDTFSWLDVLRLLEKYPEWTQINASIRQKEVI